MSYQLFYLEHLSDRDVDLLTGASGDPASARARLASDPAVVEELLADPALFEMVFEARDAELGVRLSPFLAFGILVNRVAHDVEQVNHIFEWNGPGQRLPLFDVASLRDFMAEGAHRYFLIELLTSFTKVASGRMWVQTSRGYRSRRYSELDPVRMAEVVEQLPVAQRPAGFRRLGDVALFLSGVFPDHTARHPPAPFHRERLTRSAGVEPMLALRADDSLDFHEALGAAWYRKAVEAAMTQVGAGPPLLTDVADNFRPARRVLNYLADRYLHHYDAGLSRPA